MSTTDEHDESFIILGSSPRPNGDHCNGYISRNDDDRESLIISSEGRAALEACLSQGDSPSPASLMVASTIVTDGCSTQELQSKFGELLDENNLLKETLKHNNESMKEQFLMIASCQEDMLNTHKMHKEKFDETRDLVERLRQENKKLKTDIANLLDSNAPTPIDIQSDRLPSLSHSVKDQLVKSGASSTIEFVTSPDDEIIDKLTSQLELVEKQRRQVILDNDNLVWQKESLERVVDALTKERDQFRDQVQILKMNNELKHVTEIDELKKKIATMENKILTSDEELRKRDVAAQQYEVKVATLQNELKSAQFRVLEAENVKLEMSKLKMSISDVTKIHKEQLNEMQCRLRESQTFVFQPLRVSLNSENINRIDGDVQSILAQYDNGLKRLGELMTTLVNSTTENLVNTSSVISDVLLVKPDGKSDDVLQRLNCIKKNMDRQHQLSLNYLVQVKELVLILEGVVKDLITRYDSNNISSDAVNSLTQALLARAEELDSAKQEIVELKNKFQCKDDIELLKAQIEVYKTDFNDEREARQKMASEKEDLMHELRNTQKINRELIEQLEEIKSLNPNIIKATTKPKPKPKTKSTTSSDATSTADATGNMVYKCPKCYCFSTTDYLVLEEHFNYCLDDF